MEKKGSIFFLILFLVFFINSDFDVYSQTSSRRILTLDTSIIIQKAKLLTISTYGAYDLKVNIEDVLKQSCVYANFSKNGMYLTLGIRHLQFSKVEYKQGTKHRFCAENLNSKSCNYVIVYSVNNERFFRIAGFPYSEFDSLYYEIIQSGLDIADVIISPDVDSIEFELEFVVGYKKGKRHKRSVNWNCDKCSEVFIH